MKYCFLFLSLMAFGCDSSPPPFKETGHPQLPVPLVDYVPPTEANQSFIHVLSHPWLQEQKGIKTLSYAIIEDIESLKPIYQESNRQREEVGLQPLSSHEVDHQIITLIQQLQAPIDSLPISFSPNHYSLINIPETSAEMYTTPTAFQVHKRVYLTDTSLGMPFYLDVRAFPIDNKHSPMIHEILSWHLNLLEGGPSAFSEIPKKTTTVYLGRGNRNTSHFDGSHGLAARDRGVFFALYPTDHYLYLLFADAPWSTFSLYQESLLQMVQYSNSR